jgi:hypothetical protein
MEQRSKEGVGTVIKNEKAEDIYQKNMEILKEVHLENSGCLATPEGGRYPYVYPWGHWFVILGFLSVGFHEKIEKL